MTAKQFYTEEGEQLMRLQHKHDDLLNRQGYYSKGVARLAHRIALLKEKIEKLYPEEPKKES